MAVSVDGFWAFVDVVVVTQLVLVSLRHSVLGCLLQVCREPSDVLVGRSVSLPCGQALF